MRARRYRRLLVSTFALAGLGIAVACSDEQDNSITGDGDNADSGPAEIRADAQTSGGSDAAPAMAAMRLAHLAPGSGPVDFCYQEAHAGTFVGPVLGGPGLPDAGSGDGDADAADATVTDAGPAPALGFGVVTKYLVLEGSGPMTIAIVPAGATSCASPLLVGAVTLDPGKLETVALFSHPGDGGTALDLASFTDDRTTSPDNARVRVIHAALGTAAVPAAGVLAVRGIAAKTTVFTDHVEPRKVAAASDAVNVDGLGYVTAAPIPPPATIAIGAAQTDAGVDAGFTPWLGPPLDLGLTGGSLHTAFIANGDTADTFAVLWCADLTTDGDHTTCSWVR